MTDNVTFTLFPNVNSTTIMYRGRQFKDHSLPAFSTLFLYSTANHGKIYTGAKCPLAVYLGNIIFSTGSHTPLLKSHRPR